MDVSRAVAATYDCLDSWVVHSLTELQTGQFMSVDPYNNPFPRAASGAICGGFRAVLFGLKGDQKYIQRALKLTTSWVSDKCCMYCDAALSGPNLYSFFGENAPHRSTLKSTTDFIIHGCRPNPWIRIPGFDISIVMTDWLHLVDLAITPEMAGSALAELTKTDDVWRGESQEERLRLAGLAREALEMEILVYKIRPKYHQLDHLVIDQSMYCNPMATSTYDDEDFVGKTKKMAQMCQPLYLGYQCLERYAAYVCCRWLRQLTE
ncbi:unnamed protein product [Cladocopium goreaui]|uniref:Uncharacterized protein n=1 Tax=Cladocopium goreaui TaxID=2562237 RepID=A0A9P1CPX0_9DINO|nr:unnamed protein product [Cladocopium goreaui]